MHIELTAIKHDLFTRLCIYNPQADALGFRSIYFCGIRLTHRAAKSTHMRDSATTKWEIFHFSTKPQDLHSEQCVIFFWLTDIASEIQLGLKKTVNSIDEHQDIHSCPFEPLPCILLLSDPSGADLTLHYRFETTTRKTSSIRMVPSNWLQFTNHIGS